MELGLSSLLQVAFYSLLCALPHTNLRDLINIETARAFIRLDLAPSISSDKILIPFEQT